VSSVSSALEGWTAGPWQVERRLRRGRVADAFLVRGSDGRARVLRLLHPAHVADARALARCLDEARALVHPPHPTIVPVEDAGQLADGRVYVVGEEAGDPLLVELEATSRPEDVVAVAEALAPALDALAARGLTHGHLDSSVVLAHPLRLAGACFGAFQTPGTVTWTGSREPGRRLDLGGLGSFLLDLLGGFPGASGLRELLGRCTALDDALPFPSAMALARALRACWEADPMGETRHVPGPPPVQAAPRREESSPRSVGPYRIVGLLGEGAMGRVFRAERDGQQVALKLLRKEHLKSRALLDRFFREARAVSRMRHPHIVRVLDVGEERGVQGLERAFCVMELLEGRTLGALFRERALHLDRTVEIIAQVCEALEAAHATGVVHRDVKPDNVFVVNRRGGDWVKLLDFGIAKLLQPGADGPRLPGTVIGTPNYMAPEQAAGAPVDARTDLYALGVVLFEMLAGRRPSREEEALPLLPAITPQGEAIPPELVRPILACLSVDPAGRPESAKSLGETLRLVLTARQSPKTARAAPALHPGRKAS
jgi:tRNA A-37 threonylcarbamoyl transferase component Bud32